MRLLSSRPNASIAVLTLVAAFLLWLPAFRWPFATGFGDWQFFAHMWEAGFVALTRHAEWPLWDPYHCGGITIFGNPQSQHLSPLYLVSLLAGTTLGSKIFVVLHAWAGFAGMYLLACRQGVSVPGACLAALAWCASGFFAWHIGTGHAAFLPFYFAPWVVLTLRAAVRDIRYAAALAGIMVLVLLEGGVYPFPFFVLLIAFEALVQLAQRQAASRVIVALLTAAILVAVMGAVRLWPIFDELQRSPRTMDSSDAVSLPEVLQLLTTRAHGWHWGAHEFVWAEYGNYVGWGVCVLGVMGAFACGLRPGKRSLLFGALLFLSLMLGDFGALAPYRVLHALPVYDSLRVPSRFAVLFTFYFAVLAGRGLELTERWLSDVRALPRFVVRRNAPAWLLLAALAIDLAIVQYPTIDKWRYEPIITRVSPRFYFSTLSYGDYYASLPRMNLGSRECYEAMNFQPSAMLWVGDKPQARVLRGRGAVGEVERTSSHAYFDVRMDAPGRVIVNHNYAPGWQSNVGQLTPYYGLLAIDLPAGEQHVALTYRPTMLWQSLSISMLGCMFAWLLLRFGPALERALWRRSSA